MVRGWVVGFLGWELDLGVLLRIGSALDTPNFLYTSNVISADMFLKRVLLLFSPITKSRDNKHFPNYTLVAYLHYLTLGGGGPGG